MSIEAIKQALDMLNNEYESDGWARAYAAQILHGVLIAEREAALTQPEPVEPEAIEAIYAAWHGAGIDMLGGNWKRFVGMLPKLYATPQQPVQAEPAGEKPLTDEQDRALCDSFCNSGASEYFEARPQLDSDVNRRIFYAGHRKAWIEYAAAHTLAGRFQYTAIKASK